jgi:hypothetical protein
MVSHAEHNSIIYILCMLMSDDLQGRAQIVHYLQQEMDEKRRLLQQELEQQDRQLAQADRIRLAE